jgi:hypothetical protein
VQEQQQTSTATLQQPPPSQQQQQQLQRQSAADIPAGYVLSQGPVVVPGSIGPYDPVQAAAVAAAVGVSLDELPPLAPQTRGHVYDCDWHTSFTAQEKEMVLKVRGGGAGARWGGERGEGGGGQGLAGGGWHVCGCQSQMSRLHMSGVGGVYPSKNLTCSVRGTHDVDLALVDLTPTYLSWFALYCFHKATENAV